MLTEAEFIAVQSPVTLLPTPALSTGLVTLQGSHSVGSRSWPQGQSRPELCSSAWALKSEGLISST